MRTVTLLGLGLMAGLLMTPVSVTAFCNSSGLETGAGFDCEDGSLSVPGGAGAGRSYLGSDGSLDVFVGSGGGSGIYSDGSGFGGTILGNGALGDNRTNLIITDDGRWGTVTRHGNSDFINLDPTFDDQIFPGGLDAYLDSFE